MYAANVQSWIETAAKQHSFLLLYRAKYVSNVCTHIGSSRIRRPVPGSLWAAICHQLGPADAVTTPSSYSNLMKRLKRNSSQQDEIRCWPQRDNFFWVCNGSENTMQCESLTLNRCRWERKQVWGPPASESQNEANHGMELDKYGRIKFPTVATRTCMRAVPLMLLAPVELLAEAWKFHHFNLMLLICLSIAQQFLDGDR